MWFVWVFPKATVQLRWKQSLRSGQKADSHWHGKGIPVYNFHTNKPDLMKKLDLSVTKVIILHAGRVSTLVRSAFGIRVIAGKRQQTTSVLKSQLASQPPQMASRLALPLWNLTTSRLTRYWRASCGTVTFRSFRHWGRRQYNHIRYTRDARRRRSNKVSIRKTACYPFRKKSPSRQPCGTVQLFSLPQLHGKSLHGSPHYHHGNCHAHAFLIIIPFLLLRGT